MIRKTNLHGLSEWMARVDDRRLISSLTIPGTHDSAAFTYNIPFVATQQLSFAQQLDAGIRYFDLRCGLQDDILEMVHGPTKLGLKLEDVFNTMYQWLESHPSEGLIVQLKKDRKDEHSSITFTHAVVEMISHHYSSWRVHNTTPIMSELRGKIQLFRRFREPGLTCFGIDVSRWQDNPVKPFTMRVGHGIKVTVQDHYKCVDPEPFPSLVERKCKEILQLMSLASNNDDASHWYINYTSALEFNWSYRYPPRDIAVGTWFGFKLVIGVNDTFSTAIENNHTRLGIIAMDFPDSNATLIQTLINTNFEERLSGSIAAVLACVLLCSLWLIISSLDGPIYRSF